MHGAEHIAAKIVTTWVAEGGIHRMDWTILAERITKVLKEQIEQHEKLKDSVAALLRESPLLEGEPHEGSVTGRLVKKVLEAMK